MKLKSGFTLIELLVVISIVSLLSTVVLSSLNTAREKGRLAGARQFAAQSYHVAADQAVGIWDFDDAATSSTAVDRSLSGNDGALVNLPIWSTDTYSGTGRSLQFNGTSNYVQVPYSASLAPTSAISFGAWFKANAFSGSQQDILSKTESGGWQISVNENSVCPANTLCALLHSGTYYSVSYPVASLSTNKWYFVLATYDGETLKLYLDGREVASNSAPSGSMTYTAQNSLCIGAEPQATCTGGAYWNGWIDEVRIYAKALTASDVGALYAADAPRFKLADNQ